MSHEADIPDSAVPALDDMLITDELTKRPSRSPDPVAEHRALGELIRTLAEDPNVVLQRLCEQVIRLCRADAAGVSTFEPESGQNILCWQATAGAFAPKPGSTMGWNADQYGQVMGCDGVILIGNPDRHLPELNGDTSRIHEALLAPWHAAHAPAGTLWAMKRSPGDHFDAEDARLLQSLATFAAAAWQTLTALRTVAAGEAELERQIIARRQAVRASDDKLRSLFASIDEGVAICELLLDSDGTPADLVVLEANSRFNRIMQTTDAVGKRGKEFLPDSELSWYEAYSRVIDSGVSLRFTNYSASLDGWFDAYVTRIGARRDRQFAIVLQDVTERERRDAGMAFLDDINRDLGDLTDIDATMNTVCEKIGKHVRASLCVFTEISEAADTARISHGWNRIDTPSILGVYRISDFVGEEFLRACHANETVVVRNVDTDPRVNRQSLAQLNIASFVFVPLLRDDEWVFMITVYDAVPRDWHEDEIALLQELTARVWSRLERARAEEALRASELRLRATQDSVGVGIQELDERGGYLGWNETFSDLSGYSMDDFAGRTVFDAIPNELDRAASRDCYERLVRGETTQCVEERGYVAKDGRDVWVEISTTAVRDDDQRFLYAVRAIHNVTQRRDLEETLRASEERQAFLLKLSDTLRPLADPVVIQSEASRLLGQHLAANRVHYAEIDEASGTFEVRQTFSNGLPPVTGIGALSDFPATANLVGREQIVVVDDVKADSRLSDAERAAYTSMGVAAAITVPLVKDGSWVLTLAVHQATPRHWTPEDIGLVVETAERTWAAAEQARAEEALYESEGRLRTLFDSIDEGFVEIEVDMSPDGRPVDWRYMALNASFIRLTEIDDRTGRLASEYRSVPDPEWVERITQVMSTGEALRFELPGPSLGRWFEVYLTRIGGAGSRRIAAVYNDITQRKRREINLAFLDEVSRDLANVNDIASAMDDLSARIAAHFNASLCAFSVIDEAAETIMTAHAWQRPGLPNVAGVLRIDDVHGHDFRVACRAGDTYVVRDAIHDAREDVERIEAFRMSAYVTVPVVQDGVWRFVLTLADTEPRDWADDEVALLQELTTRIWTWLERARAENALLASEEQYRTLFTSIDEGFCTIEVLFDERGKAVDYRFLEMNPSFERQTGLVDAAGKTVREFVPDHEPIWFEIYGQIATTGEAMRFEQESAAIGRYYDVYAFRIGEPGENRVAVLFNDIAERKQTEAALRESRASLQRRVAEATAELRTLSQRLLTVQEEERRRLALELHDDFGQVLTGLSLALSASPNVEQVKEARDTVAELTDRVRQRSMELRPAALDAYGLLPALRPLLERYERQAGIHVDLTHEGVDRRFRSAIEVGAYRIVQEALTNIARHAATRFAVVQLYADEVALTVSVRDAGKGFDLESAAGSGLGGMRERAHLLGGTLTVDAVPGGGVTITADLPLEEPDLELRP